MKLTPFGKRLLVQQDAPDTTSGMIALPSDAQREKSTWLVLAVSGEIEQANLPFRVGQRLYIPRHGGNPVDLPGIPSNCRLVTTDEVLGIVEG